MPFGVVRYDVTKRMIYEHTDTTSVFSHSLHRQKEVKDRQKCEAMPPQAAAGAEACLARDAGRADPHGLLGEAGRDVYTDLKFGGAFASC